MALNATISTHSGSKKIYSVHNIGIESMGKCKSFTLLLSGNAGLTFRLYRVYMHADNASWGVLRTLLCSKNPPLSKHVEAANALAAVISEAGGIEIEETSVKSGRNVEFKLCSISLVTCEASLAPWTDSPSPCKTFYREYFKVGNPPAAAVSKESAPVEPGTGIMSLGNDEDESMEALLARMLATEVEEEEAPKETEFFTGFDSIEL